MDFTGIDAHKNCGLENFGTWTQEVIKVKKLFQNRNYKRCAAICEELCETARHPVHRAFLRFYQGICYEFMGVSAHNYSSNKIPLLQFAKDSLNSALTSLGSPSLTCKLSSHDEFETYPALPAEIYTCQDQRPTLPLEFNSLSVHCRSTSWSPSSVYPDRYYEDLNLETPTKTISRDPVIHTQEQKICQNDNKSEEFVSLERKPEAKAQQNHRSRLSQTLSCNRPLEDECVPSPLFRHRKIMSMTMTAITSTPQGNSTRPLPPLPFNHKPHFITKGGRMILDPQKRHHRSQHEAQDATIAAAIFASTTAEKQDWPTPITPRFQYIARTFAPTTSSSTHDESPTPQQERTTSSSQPEKSTPSSHPAYHKAILNFQTRLQYHLTTITERIQTTQRIQEAHKANNQTRRLASFWSFKPNNNNNDTTTSTTMQPSKAATQERIATLKAEGWQVTKERHGWKGQEHYDRLRFEAEMDVC